MTDHFDPIDELPSDVLQKIDQEARKKARDFTEAINLAPDELVVPSQYFAVVSFVNSVSRQKFEEHKELDSKIKHFFQTYHIDEKGRNEFENILDIFLKGALKISGAFPTQDEAKQHADMLAKCDGLLDQWVVEMYHFVPNPPIPGQMDNQVYQDKQLDQLIIGQREQQIKAKMHHEARKQKLMENPDVNRQYNETQLNDVQNEDAQVDDVSIVESNMTTDKRRRRRRKR